MAAARKSTTKKSVDQSVENLSVEVKEDRKNNLLSKCCCSGNVLKKHLYVLAVFVLIVGGMGYLFKDKFVLALVNGKPVFRYSINQKMFSLIGKDTLENTIVDLLVKEEVVKNKVNVSKEEVDAEIAKVSESLGGTSLEDALKMQGTTMDEFRSQMEMKLQVYSLLGKDITVSKDEIDTFIKDQSESLTATTEAEKATEAESVLREQKISEKIQPWITDLLAKAKITRFLK